VGSIVAGFRVVSLVSEGAMASVFLAEDPEDGRRVALKVLGPALAGDERFRQRFLRESALAAGLHHPHIVPTIASGEADGSLFLVMEYVDGSDLRDLLGQEGRLEPDRALVIVGQMAEALDAAHAAGLVHRDVKPGNILITRVDGDEYAYLCDFGLARHLSSPSSLTGDRGFVGTIDYVPPEQIEGGTIDGRADVYSLGCLLFECLTGVRPFQRESELALVYAHLNEAPPRLTDIRPELPSALDEVVATALSKTPTDRYATCGELVAAARAALEGRAPARRSRRRRRATLVSALAVLVAVAIGIAGYLTTRGGDVASAPPAITQTSIGGARLGLMADAYKKLLGGYRAFELSEPGFLGLAFQQPGIAVYFPANAQPAHIITTWNRLNRTAAGVGPCSTIAELKSAYGDAVEPSRAGTSPDGKTIFSWVVKPNLIFDTQDQRTISAVALYEGPPTKTVAGSPESFANYVAAVETPCK
jgi:Protein kinase domain